MSKVLPFPSSESLADIDDLLEQYQEYTAVNSRADMAAALAFCAYEQTETAKAIGDLQGALERRLADPRLRDALNSVVGDAEWASARIAGVIGYMLGVHDALAPKRGLRAALDAVLADMASSGAGDTSAVVQRVDEMLGR